MSNPFIRWYTVFFSSIFLIFITMISGGAALILERDPTQLSWLVLSIFFVGSIHLGYFSRNKYRYANNPCNKNYRVTNFFTQTCSGLGMLGTIIGLMISMIGTFDGINTSDPESIKTAISTIASGMGAALTTTLVGLSCALMLETQLIAVRGKWRAY